MIAMLWQCTIVSPKNGRTLMCPADLIAALAWHCTAEGPHLQSCELSFTTERKRGASVISLHPPLRSGAGCVFLNW